MLARRHRRLVIPGLVVLLAGAILLGVALGAVWISPWTSLRLIGWRLHLTGRPTGVPQSTEVILFQLRLPRVLLAALVGAALAAAGTVFQALFRNPMADPAIIGVSSGAALGAIVVILIGAGGALDAMGVSAPAFVGALLTALLVYRLGPVGAPGSAPA